jgi:hypothetical protein
MHFNPALLLLILSMLPCAHAVAISCIIRDIKQQNVDGQLEEISSSSLERNWIGYDKHRRKVYITAEIHSQNLNKGADPTPLSLEWVKEVGFADDKPVHLIAKRLGGSGDETNIVPQSSNVGFRVFFWVCEKFAYFSGLCEKFAYLLVVN